MRGRVRFVPILLKKSPLAHELNFSAPLVRPTLGDVRDHIDSRKSDQGLSYMSYRGFEREGQLRTDIRENFGAAQFSTFSTISANSGHVLRGRLSACRRD
jgi:hypothetical protein